MTRLSRAVVVGVFVSLAGCSPYHELSPGSSGGADLRTEARACLLGNASPTGLLFGMVGAVTAPLEAQGMDACMRAKGYGR